MIEKGILKKINDFIDENDFSSAEEEVETIISDISSSEEDISYANMLIGYIHTSWQNANKKPYKAKRALLECIDSKYPRAMAYVWYADVLEDKNISINYLKRGLEQFPQDPNIYKSLMFYDVDSEIINYIKEIDEKGILDLTLLGYIVEISFERMLWSNAEGFLRKIVALDHLDEYQKEFYKLLLMFALIMQEKEIQLAEKSFGDIMKNDIANNLHYAPYMGYLYCQVKNGNIELINNVFDKLPVTNSLEDFMCGPWWDISVDFQEIYHMIFNELRTTFSVDKQRKLKLEAVESYYLYFKSENYDDYQYSKKHLQHLKRYATNIAKTKTIMYAICNMQMHFNQYSDAFYTLLEIFEEEKEIDELCPVYDLFENCDEKTFSGIYEEFLYKVQKDRERILSDFSLTILDLIISRMFKSNIYDRYKKIIVLCEEWELSDLYKLENTFEIAYSYCQLEETSSRGILLYEKIIEENPKNSSVFNNLGVIYENKKELSKALEYFERAKDLNQEKELYQNNFDRVNELITQYRKSMKSIKSENIWFITKLQKLHDICDTNKSFSCSYQERAKILSVTPYRANELFDKMIKEGYLFKESGEVDKQKNVYSLNCLVLEWLDSEKKRIDENKIYEAISEKINLDNIENMGYTTEIRDLINGINRLDIKEMLVRDISECVISLISQQYKSCIVMCGSLIEALLVYKVQSNGCISYDCGTITKGKKGVKNIERMSLEELIEVAKKENIINMESYHLSSFVRGYRNVIHPSVEIRKGFLINLENAEIMWKALLYIIRQTL